MTTDQRVRHHDLVLDALGDGTRRAILELLSETPKAVVDIAAALPVSRPAVSLHLKVLRDAGLVRDSAHGTRRVYRLDPDGLALLRTYLDRLWAGALGSFAAAAEAAHKAEAAPAAVAKQKSSKPPKRLEGEPIGEPVARAALRRSRKEREAQGPPLGGGAAER